MAKYRDIDAFGDPDDEVLREIQERQNEIPMIVEPRCKVCNWQYRPWVDAQIAKGVSISSIHREMVAAGFDAGYASLDRHKKRHVNLNTRVYREIAERNMDQFEETLSKRSIQVITGMAMLDAIIASGYSDLVEGKLKIEARDLIKAVEVKKDMDRNAAGDMYIKLMQQVQGLRAAMEETLSRDDARAVIERARELAGDAGTQLIDVSQGDGFLNKDQEEDKVLIDAEYKTGDEDR